MYIWSELHYDSLQYMSYPVSSRNIYLLSKTAEVAIMASCDAQSMKTIHLKNVYIEPIGPDSALTSLSSLL